MEVTVFGIFTLVIHEQPENNAVPMEVTDSGMVTSVNSTPLTNRY